MTKIFQPLLALIASATDRELAKYVEYLKEENKILRARIPGQVHTKPEERKRLIKLGKSIGRAIEELITIVKPGTFYRWIRDEKSTPKTKNPKGGQRKPRDIRKLVIEIAKTTGFGYTRIIGELRKLGIKKISRQTVRNILKEEGVEPGPDRTSDCWDNFVKRQSNENLTEESIAWHRNGFTAKMAQGMDQSRGRNSTNLQLRTDSSRRSSLDAGPGRMERSPDD